jgi:hypothetical protein
MAQIIHDISSPNDGLGDELRVAFDHQNDMNTELYTGKVDKETGKELSTNDFTDALKTKLLGIEDGAEVNVQSDWSQSDNTADDYIKNKPTLNNYVNTIGFFDYNNDNTTPLTLVANTEKKLSNDCIGAYTNIDHPTHGVTRLFDPTTNNIVLDELGVGDLVKLRVDINVTTATANQVFKCVLRLGIGTSKEFEIIIHEEQIKDTGAHQRTIFTGFYVGSEEVRLALGELVLISDHAGSVVVNGFFFEGIKRNVNFVELSGGVSTTPTLQEVTTEGNETTDGIGVQSLIVKSGTPYRTLVDDEMAVTTFGGGGVRNTYLQFVDTFINFIKNTSDVGGNYLLKDSGFGDETLAFESDITADNADALKRDGSNANADVDLGTFRIKASELVTQFGGNPTKSMTLKGTNLTNERTAEFQDQDYFGIEDISNKGASNGYVPLNASVLIPSEFLPSYVDDIIDGYLNAGVFYAESSHTTAITGEVGKIYVDLTTGQSSKQYRWSGSVYIQITNGLIGSTADVPDSSNKRYQTDNQKTFNDATSSIQTQIDSKQNKMSWISSSSPYTGTGSTALQKLSNAGSSGNGSFPAKANTRYKIEVQFQLSGLSTTTNFVQFGILGSAGITSVNGQSLACKSASLISSNTPSYTALNSATISSALMTTGTQTFARATISIEVVTSTAGTLIIAFATNVSTTPIVENHLIRFIELGPSSTTSSTDIV